MNEKGSRKEKAQGELFSIIQDGVDTKKRELRSTLLITNNVVILL